MCQHISGEEARCGFEKEAVSELIVEIFTPEPGSSFRDGHGPAEVTRGEQLINIFIAAPEIDSVEDFRVQIWRACKPITERMPCLPMLGETKNSLGLMLYVSDEWVGGHENDILAQVTDNAGVVQAQGRSTFSLDLPSNQTEGAMHALASALPAPGYGSWLHPWSDGCNPQTLQDVRFCQKKKQSQIKELKLSVAECSQPRAPLRMYELTATRWNADGHFEVFLPDKAKEPLGLGPDAKEAKIGMLNVQVKGIPSADKCAFWDIDNEVTNDQIAGGMTAFLLVGVTGGSVEHLGHFFLDFLFNIYRLMAGSEADWWKDMLEAGNEDIELRGSGIVLVDDMRDTVADLPPRKFYSLVRALLPQTWMSLGQLPDNVCFHRVIMGFGGLEVIRARDAASIRNVVHAPKCRGVVVNFQKRLLRHYGLAPRVVSAETEDRVRLYLSREDTGWRRLVNEKELVAAWNDKRPEHHLQMTSLHTMEFGAQLALLQRSQAMIGINGGQINALFFLPQGSTCAAIFAMRWTDQNFGYVYLSWLRHRKVRYIQYDITRGGDQNLDWLTPAKYDDDWSGSMRAIRDADIRMPQTEFDDFVQEAVAPDGSGKYDASDDTAELEKVLLNFEQQASFKAAT